jgi:hypothetical protein
MGTSGEERKGKADLDFVRVGTTHREEVIEKLGWTDVGIKDERIFLGRWISSAWGILLANPYGSPPPDRHWEGHNLLMEFDEKGVVKQYSVFGDEELVQRLSAWVTHEAGHLLDLTRPIEFRVEHLSSSGTRSGVYECTLVLAKDSLEFREGDSCYLHGLKISPTKISHLGLSGLIDRSPNGGQPPDPQHIKATIHFIDNINTRFGKKVTFIMDVPAIMSLVKYLAQTRSR